MQILVTGAAGFIGYHVCQALLKQNIPVIGIDNLNSYYDVNLKKARLAQLQNNPHFNFYTLNIDEQPRMQEFAKQYPNLTHIIHLAAQAGVRYSLVNPHAYITANIVGHLNMLEYCKQLPKLQHFVYASSSSVYGANQKLPFSTEDRTDHPLSLYAATKKSCELMSYTYSHLFQIPSTGLRFFTVYGPWGRPDMSAFIFTKAILEGTPVPVFNQGQMQRNFTYIDDIVEGVLACLKKPPVENQPMHRLYNLGNNRAESLLDFIKVLEDLLGKKAMMQLEPLQPGDVPETIADISSATQDFGFNPKTNIQEGLGHFVNWYKEFYHVENT